MSVEFFLRDFVVKRDNLANRSLEFFKFLNNDTASGCSIKFINYVGSKTHGFNRVDESPVKILKVKLQNKKLPTLSVAIIAIYQ